MRLMKVAAGRYLCDDDRWFSIVLEGRRWWVMAGGDRIGSGHATRQSAAAALASMLRNWRTAI